MDAIFHIYLLEHLVFCFHLSSTLILWLNIVFSLLHSFFLSPSPSSVSFLPLALLVSHTFILLFFLPLFCSHSSLHLFYSDTSLLFLSLSNMSTILPPLLCKSSSPQPLLAAAGSPEMQSYKNVIQSCVLIEYKFLLNSSVFI